MKSKEGSIRCKDGFLSAIITLLAVILIISAVPTEKEAALYTDTVRLHILANSNGESDQELKLEIRDRLLESYGSILSEYGDPEAARAQIPELLPRIEEDVDRWIIEYGASYKSEVSVGEEWYERREYGDLSIPEGYYTSLKIELGEAGGQNWWCVMYPPICLNIATEEADGDDAILGFGDQAGALISKGKYTVKFKLLEMASEAISLLGKMK
jgi:stage II sporulation protein R